MAAGATGRIDIASPADGPFDARLRREAAEVVDRAIVKLPARYRLPLVLKEIGDLTLSEIGTILGLKEATVKTRVHRARLALRAEVATHLAAEEKRLVTHPRHVCLAMLQAKMEALDRGAPFPVPSADVCERCRAFFRSLDLTVEACRWIEGGKLPEALHRTLIAELERSAG